MAHANPVPEKTSSAKYFYGRITRDEAEIILRERGFKEGQYLLRESISPLGNYAISLCHSGKVHHYIIEKQVDGQFMIPEGQKFPGPLTLIRHYEQHPAGFVTTPTIPCNRLPSQAPVAFRGMTYNDLEQEIISRAKSVKKVNMDKALGPMREHLVKMVARDLHTNMPWYHAKIEREEAEKRIRKEGHEDGKFLVRQREGSDSKVKPYALTLSLDGSCRHYVIKCQSDGKYTVDDGPPKFECLIMLVDHYHNKQDGLACKLVKPVCPSKYDRAKFQKYMDNCSDNLVYYSHQTVNNHNGVNNNAPPRESAPVPPLGHPMSRKPSQAGRKLPPVPNLDGDWVHPSEQTDPILIRDIGISSENLEDEYVRVRKDQGKYHWGLELDREQITLQERLGGGQFGDVVKGVCKLGVRNIPVAIKTLKNEQMVPGQVPELLKEAQVMKDLSHKHIVRMIGLCKGDCIMLVLEIAPLGPLNKFLPHHKEMQISNVVELMWQVAQGMAYLESMKFVHRDLAARNVLLVTERLAKISDFGMSKALARDSNYYEANTAGKWPLKWYAPECVYYWKFDSRSDVWSYGISFWEAVSYGDKPYRKMKGQDILNFLNEGKRLTQPYTCPNEAYDIMLECWEFDPNMRPTFSQLVYKVKDLFDSLKAASQ
ncbi:tyrosine-protein kinase SYK-like [Gigantopelta aegis]|uniref:tyrosine-protein kinase SYK-like n=1 Tax=Gigantopelta aegis TaxID=1735272 RepID=UPI001B8873D9|nr:tyrosine-protein kinase SYK-like [Gigantopelta aegis]